MIDPDSPVPSEAQESSVDLLQKEVRALRTMLHITLVVIVVVSGSLSVVLLRQVNSMRRQMREMSTVVANYVNNEAPVLEEFRLKLDDFARRNPDFRPILSKYFQPTPPAGATPATIAAPPGTTAPGPRK